MKNRREFLIKSTLGVAGLALAPTWLKGAPAIIKNFNKPDSNINGVQIGCITYSFRSLPDQSAEATLKYVIDSGLSAIELMGDPAESFAGMPTPTFERGKMWQLGRKARDGQLTDDEKKEWEELQKEVTAYSQAVATWRANADMKPFEQVRKMYKDAGVSIYAFKPSAFGANNTDAEIAYGMKAAKALGASHVTLEHPANDAQTLKLGKMGERYGMSVAYHGHEQQTFDFWDTALAQSPKNALNLDMGHYIAAGNTDLFPLLEKQHGRILSMHTKDRQTPAHGKGNVVWGEGDTPIGDVLKTIQKNKYKFPATIELEYQVPENSDPVKEVQKCVEFCRKSLA
ncbi:sugar phosphate isomerase/epimerase family protein [Algoriphagus zhangzhouensis]|uniref:Sugar phosphate isomerase/epimerase n=1 Tax=Algoriphagus zhangzhouensis TaxID=1073327 RepID=A0A1M7Z401_9BACT|nr:TIM barrel protein [Algoriphagus zhangzhouensis]TDY48506.1 sugar phosphate isomerase/epimerase [Algoriphagus zhangzhouensis]SHO59554.1 Sugar phosphate isomerase/epimerase [Algoriphagus zhangzhouensis]